MEKEKNVDAVKIVKTHILFIPCTDLKAMCKSLSFAKADTTQPGGNDESYEGESPSVQTSLNVLYIL
ncbi:hypothetical protein [Bacteroides nordii]|uniref:hypothetical protein n=1 Tax=Bacteroides nordii TaxID=291645 RepID=UPI00399AE13C